MPTVLENGKIELSEQWQWTSGDYSKGQSLLVEVYDNETFIGAGGVSFYQVMPTYHNSTGKKAYIMNMYTAPEYRRQGIALHTLDLLVKAAKDGPMSRFSTN